MSGEPEQKKKFFIAEPSIGEKELAYATEAINSTWISSAGKFIKRFEEEFAKLHDAKCATTTSNGTTALHLAFMGIGVKPGNEIILPTFTFGACANAILHVGGTPVFVDVSEDDWNLDPAEVERAITPRTKAILAVHTYGHPCKIERLATIAKKYNLFVIEDCAEAHGAKENGKIIGSFGHINCFSFFGNKIITTGEGGMCVSNDQQLMDKMVLYKNHGIGPEKRYFHLVAGHNFRMTNPQAAIGLAQLERLNRFLKIREEHETLYRKILSAAGNTVTFSPKRPNSNPVYWMHSFLINSKKISRDELVKKMLEDNIETRPFFPPLHSQPPFEKFANGSFPVAEKISAAGIQLPSSVNLKDEDITYIAKKVLTYIV